MIKTYINKESLHERTAGDKELVSELMELLIAEKSNYHNCMIKAQKNNDFLSLAAEAHKFKSAVGVLGFDNLAEALEIVEKNASKKNEQFEFQNKINAIFISLNNHIIELENSLKNRLWDY